MTGRSDPVPYFSVSGYSGITNAAFQTLAITQINEGLDSFTSPNCSLYNGIDSGGVYPPGTVSMDAVVGALDEPITRSLTEDFKKLVQYIGTNIDFTDSESSAAWCGEVGIACVDCKAKYVGNGLNKRCADRLMSARMYNVIKPLQKLVRENIIGDKLKVLESWDEPYDGKPNGDSPNSLHMEGRAITLQLSVTNTPNNLKLVSKLAVCAGADYVAHNNDHLTIAVKKMSGYEEQSVKFPKTELIAVDPPSNKKSEYSLPVVFTSEDANEFPLFDSDNKGELILADNATVRMFMSDEEGIRYFRLSPRIVQCYSALVYHENKRNKENDLDINIEVIRGYVSNFEQAGLFEDSDKRYNTHTLGVAMQIKYSAGSPDSHTPARLAQRAIDKCSPIFNEDDERVGIGLYSDSVFVDIRSPDDDLVWVEKNELIPGGMTLEQYSDHMYKRAELAIQNRIIDPDDFDEACNLAIVPKIQSFDYTYKLPEFVLRKRKRRAASNKCVPKSDTDFCLATTKHREAEVNEIWKEMNRKHLYAKDMRTALEGCFGACGTCLEGSIYDEKRRHCSILVHRMNFGTMNDSPDNTNFFARDNMETKKYACTGGHHCLMRAPVFSILAPSIKRLYRPDPTKSVEEEIYSSEENPSPLLPLLDELYAIHAKGAVSFWVADEKDMTSMKEPLTVAMMYNKNVTDINIYVTNSISKEPVNALVESYVMEMSTTGCPLYTRETLPPFKVLDVPHHISKRSVTYEDNTKEKLLMNRINYAFIHMEL